jgi:pimeloyl-ACP methyl ester carboxylesterase
MQQPELQSLTLVDAPVPGTTAWDRVAANPRAWHVAFHANVDLAERLVTGNEHVYIEEFVRVRIGNPAAISEDDLLVYVDAYRRPGSLRAAFSAYAAIPSDAAHNRVVLTEPLSVPTLTVGGTLSTSGSLMAEMGAEVSSNHHNVIIDGTGHWIPEEAPTALVNAWRTWRAGLPTR